MYKAELSCGGGGGGGGGYPPLKMALIDIISATFIDKCRFLKFSVKNPILINFFSKNGTYRYYAAVQYWGL